MLSAAAIGREGPAPHHHAWPCLQLHAPGAPPAATQDSRQHPAPSPSPSSSSQHSPPATLRSPEGALSGSSSPESARRLQLSFPPECSPPAAPRPPESAPCQQLPISPRLLSSSRQRPCPSSSSVISRRGLLYYITPACISESSRECSQPVAFHPPENAQRLHLSILPRVSSPIRPSPLASAPAPHSAP